MVFLLIRQWWVWLISDSHPPAAMPAELVFSLLTIHEVAQTDKARWAGMIPLIKWRISLGFMPEGQSSIFHSSVLVVVLVI